MGPIRWHQKWGIYWLRRKRQILPYHPMLDAASEASVNTGEPDWKKWIVGILALLTLVNTTDVALTGLTMTISISTFLNVALILMNAMIALFYVWNMCVDTIFVPRHRLRNLIKCGLTACACYGMVMAAFATLAALTPGANLLVVVLFVANAVAIGVIVMNTACDLFVPRIETVFNNWRYTRRGMRRNPTRLSKHELANLEKSSGIFLTRCANKELPSKFKDKGFICLEGENDDNFLLGMRRRAVLFFKAERESLVTKYVGSALAEDDKIKSYANAQRILITKSSFWPNTSPYELYMKKLGSRVDKLASDLKSLYELTVLKNAYTDASSNSKIGAAYAVLATITGAEPAQYGSGLVVIDRLVDACRYLKDKKAVDEYVGGLNYYVAFDYPMDDLGQQIDALVEITKVCVNKRVLKKLFKLHDTCGMTMNEMTSALIGKLKALLKPEDHESIQHSIAELMTQFECELKKRNRACPSTDHGCIACRQASA